MKKLLSLLLTAAMLCAVAVPATFATAPADNARTRYADIFDFIDILEDCVGMIELTPVEVYDHNKNGVVDIFDGIIVLEGIIGLGEAVKMPLVRTPGNPAEPPVISTATPTIPTTIAPPGDNGEGMVYIPTRGGTRYHRRENSCGMLPPVLYVTVSEALAQGFTACGRCY
ncbi:MAG: hypothetical protein FWF94_02620 [Oscillospiraceae bacterium]|nr:hypothetical protein [Oscillospiraceae bacterium]